MAELPTPHSIAIGTIISLYSDPNSPLVVLDWHNNDRDNDGIGGGGGISIISGSNANDDGRPRSTSEWTLRLMNLIQQLVMKEDEGAVVLPNTNMDEFGLLGGGANPAADDADDDGDGGIHNIRSIKDPIRDIDNIILDDDEFFLKHVALEGKDILSDVLGTFGSSLPSMMVADDDEPEMQSTMAVGPKQLSGWSGNDDDAGGSLNFCMEPLSLLLNRIDDAFTPSSNSKLRRHNRRRTPPSLALLSRLQMASSSVDDLMNLLDEWHALLEGVHVGYPPPPQGDNPGLGNQPPTAISIDGESTFGVYLRKLCLGMEEIPFEALSRLWDALREFVREEIALGERCAAMEKQGEDGGACIVEEDDGYELRNTTSDWLPSSPQIERIVRNTCLEHDLDSLLIRENASMPSSKHNSTLRTHLNHKRQRHLYNLLETHPECPSIHFLLFLSSLANGQRSQALESLHRYFDYAMIHERKERAERALMLQASEGGTGAAGIMSNTGMMTTMGSGMGGITGGMTGGIVNGAMQAGVGQQRGGAAGAAGGNNNNNAPTKIFRESNVMQYAAILLAQTYHRFGYTTLSLQATEEAIRVAQQSGDGECVCFANGWLALVSSSLGNGGGGTGGQGNAGSVYASVGGLDSSCIIGSGSMYRPLVPSLPTAAIGSTALSSRREEEAMLRRCQERASARGLASLAAGASLELARRTAYQRQRAGGDAMDDGNGNGYGGLVPNDEENTLSLAWDSIQGAGRMPNLVGTSASAGHGRGVHLGGRHHGAGAGGGGTMGAQAPPTDIYNMTPADARGVLGRQNVAVAGLWESTGHASLASLSACASLYGSQSNVEGGEERTMMPTGMDRVLNSFTNGPGLDVWGMGGMGRTKNRQGKAYATILNNLGGVNNSERLTSSIASSVLHEWSVRSCDLSLARGLNILLANNAAFPSSSPAGGGGGALPAVEKSLVFLTSSTHLSLQRGEYDRAKACARRACWLSHRHGLLFHLGWNLLQLSLIDLEASMSNKLSVERALPPLLECLDLSERYSMDPLRAMALAALSKVLLCMGRYKKARAMLRAAMPLVMQHGHVWFQGEAYLTLAKCYLAEASESKDCQMPNSSGDGSTIGGGDLVGKRKRSPYQRDNQQHDSTDLELRETALIELKKSATCFEQIEDLQRLRQVYYLQAMVYQSLPNAKKKRDEAAKMFVRLTADMRERVGDSVLSGTIHGKLPNNEQTCGSKQWDVLIGVMITNSCELQRCVSMKQQR